MKLLIVTQAVDTNDPVLGFFVRWIEEFAKRCERVDVICLKEGKHTLPANVRVHSLGKEHGAASRVVYAFRFLSLMWRLRRDYDAVFVHMNPEYMILGGLWWRIWGKKIALWYTHKSVNLKLRIAVLFAHVVFTASAESFRLHTKKLQIMGHGIDTDFFSPDAHITRGDWVLSVGRLTPSKRHDLAIRAAASAGRELRVIGEGPEHKNLETLANSLGTRAHFLGGFTQMQLRDEYRRAAYLVHTSETGSLDKVVLEAFACGLPVITTNIALADLPVAVVSPTPEAIAKEILAAHPPDAESLAAFVRECHALQHLIPAILNKIRTP